MANLDYYLNLIPDFTDKKLEVTVVILFAVFLPIFLPWFIQHLRLRYYVNKIPGPRSLPIIGNLLQVQKPRSDLFKDNCRIADQFRNQKIFKYWIFTRPMIHFYTPEAIEPLLTSNNNISKHQIYKYLEDWLGTGLLTSTGEKWKIRRRLITPAFHFQILNDFLPIFCDNAEILVKQLRKKANKEEFNPYPFITLCTLDIINETAMGVKINAQTNADSEYVKAIQIVGHYIERRGKKPWWWSKFLFRLIGPGKLVDQNLKILHDYTAKVIRERAKEMQNVSDNFEMKEEDKLLGKKKRRAFLDLLLHTSENGKVLSFADIQEEVDTFMFEGHDTTAAATLFGVYLIGSDPEVQKKLHAEMDEIFGDDDRQPTLEDLKNMKYLECCIKEILRLFPSAAFIGRTITEDFKVLNYTIPKGAIASIDFYNLHRNPDIFPNPEKFDPDRFLPENAVGRNPFAYTPFSAGPRNCVGQKFAQMEEKILLSYIIRNFNIESVQSRESLTLEILLVIRCPNGIFIKLTERNKNK